MPTPAGGRGGRSRFTGSLHSWSRQFVLSWGAGLGVEEQYTGQEASSTCVL